jgi:hypothetical protein
MTATNMTTMMAYALEHRRCDSVMVVRPWRLWRRCGSDGGGVEKRLLRPPAGVLVVVLPRVVALRRSGSRSFW